MALNSFCSKFAARFMALALVLPIGCSGDDEAGEAPHNHDHDAAVEDSSVSCQGETTESYFAGIEKAGPAGIKVKIADSNPAPPAARENVWTVELHDASGAPLDGATIAMTPWMPIHQHGAPAPGVTGKGNGVYELKPIFFTMTGPWQLTFNVTTAAGVTDKVEFYFCISG